ncbi:MAG: CCA tRNA nucleotidyltransferase [Acidobacteriaceae bacterium]
MQQLESLEPFAIARTLAGAFADAGEELYLVGGAVRDSLLGRAWPTLDLDFATSAVPRKTLHIVDSLAAGSAYKVGERFGTIGWRLGDRILEITTYRAREVYSSESRKPSVEWGETLLDDLSRRDFTVNAMAVDPIRFELIDPLGGASDLHARRIKAVGDSGLRFSEDPLRLLRAVRLAAQLDFSVDDATWRALQEHSHHLSAISRERIRDEYGKILTGPNPVHGLTLLRDGQVLQHSVPALLELDRMPDHGPRHRLSLWDHVMRVVEGVPNTPALRWAALLHDIAKPRTRTVDEATGRPRFFHHEEVGAAMTRDILTRLRYSNQFVDDVALLVETHMQLHAYTPEWSDGAVRRLMLRMGPCLSDALHLVRADAAGHSRDGTSQNAPKFDSLEERIKHLDETEVRRLRSPLSGNDLMSRYGRPPGPWIRRVKAALDEEVLEGRLAPGDKESAWRLADMFVQSV